VPVSLVPTLGRTFTESGEYVALATDILEKLAGIVLAINYAATATYTRV
jgi:hypothetical protein